jgi:methionyl-tRNA formyltransferase
MIEKGESSRNQEGLTTNAPKISKSEAEIDFTLDSTMIANAIRAFTYEPGAWTLWKGESFKICATKVSSNPSGTPGQIAVIDKSVFVSTGSGSLELLRVIPAGKKEMDAIDWARGARLTGGEIFG